jgi:AcrR family transcriptional regulator
MGIQERKEQEKAALRQKILVAAAAIIDVDGVLGFSMRKLAKKINYSATTIYTFFKDKEELLRSLSELGARRFAATIANNESWNSKPPIERLTIVMRKFLDVCLENPKAYLNSFFSEMPGSPPILLKFNDDSHSNPSFEMFLQIIDAGNADGSMNVPDPKAAVQVCWAASHGLLLALIASPETEVVHRQSLIEILISMLIAGLTAKLGKN